MANPLRFRRSHERWTLDRVRSALLTPLDDNIGATMRRPWYHEPDGYEARRFEMDNGDVALFAWDDDRAYWLGNTETPSALWRTEKYTFAEVRAPVADWAERELLAQLYDESPWLTDFPAVTEFFLPILLSKDGRETTRAFFDEHAVGFPDATREDGLAFYEELLAGDVLTDRHVMAGKLGTSEQLDLNRMRAAMSEFTVAKLLAETGHDVTPEIEVTTGHFIDFRADKDGTGSLVEVTRPRPTQDRSANSPVTSVRETAETKTRGQLAEHEGGVTLFVDCSSFTESDWQSVLADRPDVRHRPAVVFRATPDGSYDGYTKGTVPVDLPAGVGD